MIEPQPIQTAPQMENSPLLLYCPDQGGWQTGVWFYGKWLAYIETSIVLEPTHWTYPPTVPPGFEEDGCKRLVFHSRFVRSQAALVCRP